MWHGLRSSHYHHATMMGGQNAMLIRKTSAPQPEPEQKLQAPEAKQDKPVQRFYVVSYGPAAVALGAHLAAVYQSTL